MLLLLLLVVVVVVAAADTLSPGAVVCQVEEKEGGEHSDGESANERALFDRAALKKKAQKKELDEIRKRETEARRAAMAAKIAVDLDKVGVCSRAIVRAFMCASLFECA